MKRPRIPRRQVTLQHREVTNEIAFTTCLCMAGHQLCFADLCPTERSGLIHKYANRLKPDKGTTTRPSTRTTELLLQPYSHKTGSKRGRTDPLTVSKRLKKGTATCSRNGTPPTISTRLLRCICSAMKHT